MKHINEIGNTPAGNFALNAVKGRAAARLRYNNTPEEKAKLDRTLSQVSDAQYKNTPKDINYDNEAGYRYGYQKGMEQDEKVKQVRECSKKLGKMTYFTEADVHNLVVETAKKMLMKGMLGEDEEMDVDNLPDGYDKDDCFPQWAIYYAVYGDPSGLDDKEVQLVDNWMQKHGYAELVDASDGTHFCHRPEFGLACDVADWVILRHA